VEEEQRTAKRPERVTALTPRMELGTENMVMVVVVVGEKEVESQEFFPKYHPTSQIKVM